MTIVIHQREPFNPDYTYGSWSLDGEHLCDILERPWLNNDPKVSCIPAGDYECERFNSPHNGDVWLVKNVPNRSMIEVHTANFVRQLEGCLAVGIKGKIGSEYAVTNSVDTMDKLHDILPDNFTLRIINAPAT